MIWRSPGVLRALIPALIVLGAIGGTLTGMREAGGKGRGWPQQVAARVGDREILRQDLDLAVEQFTLDLHPRVTPADRLDILNRLIDEELLLQAGLNQQVYETDPTVRLEVLRVMLAMICTPASLPAGGREPAVEGAPARTEPCASPKQRHELDQYVAGLRETAQITLSQDAPQ